MQELWKIYKRCNICIIEIAEREGKKRVEELSQVIMIENFLKLMTDIKLQTQEAQRIPKLINSKNLYLRILHSNCKKSKTN